MSLRLCLFTLGTVLAGCADSPADRPTNTQAVDTRAVDSLNAIGVTPERGDSTAPSTRLAPGARLDPGGMLAPGGSLTPEAGLAP